MTSPVRHLQKLRLPIRGVVHVGASSGQEVAEYHEAGVQTAIFIEPLDEPFQALQEKVSAIPGFLAVQTACSDVCGDAALNLASNEGQSSSLLEPKLHKILHAGVHFERRVTVPTTTLDVLLERLGQEGAVNVGDIDTLVLDVQGAELLVLSGADRTLDQMTSLYCEVSHVDLYEQNARFYDVIAFCRSRGLDLFNCSLNRKLYGDAMFVRLERLEAGARLGRL